VGFSLSILFLTGSLTAIQAAEAPKGIALGIVYDTSGSMKESVRDADGKTAPKYVIANRALGAIVERLQAFVAAAPKDSPRQLQAGLVVFKDRNADVAVKFGPFDANALRNWVRQFSNPMGSTPLGLALETAGNAVLASSLPSKHVLVLTDGINTEGPDPAITLKGLQEQSSRKNSSISVYFVAFDVDAKVFAPVKKLGATV
jgi:transposase-like protein